MTDGAVSNGGFQRWAPLAGYWGLEHSEAVFHGKDSAEAYGLIRAPDSLGVGEGTVSCTMRFPHTPGDEFEPQGRIVFSFNPRTEHHFSAGIGGFRSLYNIEQFVPGEGWSPLKLRGHADALPRDRAIDVVLRLRPPVVG
jgi:hypothetical protein